MHLIPVSRTLSQSLQHVPVICVIYHTSCIFLAVVNWKRRTHRDAFRLSFQKKNYLFLVRKLVDKGVLNEEEVESYWRKLTDLTLPAVRVHCSFFFFLNQRFLWKSFFPIDFDQFTHFFITSLSPASFQKLIENFQLQSQCIKLSLPLAEMQSRLDMLQVSHQTIEGAT